MQEKLLDSRVISEMGWNPTYKFEDAVRLTYEWYKQALAT
jgi:dTDP-D-glucose 4,6-dehydratase